MYIYGTLVPQLISAISLNKTTNYFPNKMMVHHVIKCTINVLTHIIISWHYSTINFKRKCVIFAECWTTP